MGVVDKQCDAIQLISRDRWQKSMPRLPFANVCVVIPGAPASIRKIVKMTEDSLIGTGVQLGSLLSLILSMVVFIMASLSHSSTSIRILRMLGASGVALALTFIPGSLGCHAEAVLRQMAFLSWYTWVLCYAFNLSVNVGWPIKNASSHRYEPAYRLFAIALPILTASIIEVEHAWGLTSSGVCWIKSEHLILRAVLFYAPSWAFALVTSALLLLVVAPTFHSIPSRTSITCFALALPLILVPGILRLVYPDDILLGEIRTIVSVLTPGLAILLLPANSRILQLFKAPLSDEETKPFIAVERPWSLHQPPHTLETNSPSRLSVSVCTYNANSRFLPIEFLDSIRGDYYDMYILGFQNLAQEDWVHPILQRFRREYQTIGILSFGDLRLLVLLRQHLVHKIIPESIVSSSVPLNIGSINRGQGAVIFQFSIRNGPSFSITNLLMSQFKSQLSSVLTSPSLADVDIVFGDFSSTLTSIPTKASDLMKRRKWSKLSNSDSLLHSRIHDCLLMEYNEGRTTFPPTSTYHGTTCSTPSWSDRIFWSCAPGCRVSQISYYPVMTVISRHKPISSQFNMSWEEKVSPARDITISLQEVKFGGILGSSMLETPVNPFFVAWTSFLSVPQECVSKTGRSTHGDFTWGAKGSLVLSGQSSKVGTLHDRLVFSLRDKSLAAEDDVLGHASVLLPKGNYASDFKFSVPVIKGSQYAGTLSGLARLSIDELAQ